jgi:chromosome segregation ATPase
MIWYMLEMTGGGEMDGELLAAIGKVLQEQLEPMKQDITGLQKQNDIISFTVVKILGETEKIKDSVFELQSDAKSLQEGQQRIETKQDRMDADVEVIGNMCRDHELRIQDL